MKSSRLFAVLIIAIACTLASQNALADTLGTSQLRISDGATTVTVPDDNGDGIIVFMGDIGNFSFVISTGISKPTLGTSTVPHLDLGSVEVTGHEGGGTLTISFTDTGFLTPESWVNSFTSLIGGSCFGCTGTFSTYLDNSNTAFGTEVLLGTTSFGSGAFSSSFSSAELPTGVPYSLTEVVTINMPGMYQSSSFNAELQATPEPGSLILLGSGMAGLGLLAWRRSRKKTVEVEADQK